MNPNASLKSLNAKSRVIASLSACIRQPGSSDSASIRSASVSCGMGMRGSFACRSSGFRLSGEAMQACRLSARDLACRRGDRVLFSGLSFALEPGQAVQVTGANGIGKSSLSRILAGLLRPYAGGVEREGPVGLLDERLALDEHRPLGAALKFWGRIDGETTLVHDAPGRYLSTGQRKRAALARLTGQRAASWLLDEPLNGLDAHAIELFEELVEDHCTAGGIAVIASHQPFGSHRLTQLALADYAA